MVSQRGKMGIGRLSRAAVCAAVSLAAASCGEKRGAPGGGPSDRPDGDGRVVARPSAGEGSPEGTAPDPLLAGPPRLGVACTPRGAAIDRGWIDEEAAAGLGLWDVTLFWSEYEPSPVQYNQAHVREVERLIDAALERGWLVGLRLAWHYPPRWATGMPNARFRDQYGHEFSDTGASGKNVVDLVFNEELREAVARTMSRAFADLGDRAGRLAYVAPSWGWYGELNYPEHGFGEEENCYWAYGDPALASFREELRRRYGAVGDLNAAWGSSFASFDEARFEPGERSAGHRRAADFLGWYHGSLERFVLWQRAEVRKHYAGWLSLLCGSWGVREGQGAAAVAADLDGSTSPERNGEVQRGFDFPRYFRALSDAGEKRLVVQCTWMDSDPRWEGPGNPSPAEWLASLARAHGWPCGGEPAGDSAAIDVAVGRVFKHGYRYLVYVPESRLFTGEYPTMRDLGESFARGLAAGPPVRSTE